MKRLSVAQWFLCTIISGCLGAPSNARADFFGPSDYNECIIEGMKGVQSDLAAKLVQRACLQKFTPPKENMPESTEIPFEDYQKLSGKAEISAFGTLDGSIYNGNSDWTITEVIINLTEKDGIYKFLDSIEEKGLKPRLYKYKIHLIIPPYTSKEFSIFVSWPKDQPYEWNIREARGYN